MRIQISIIVLNIPSPNLLLFSYYIILNTPKIKYINSLTSVTNTTKRAYINSKYKGNTKIIFLQYKISQKYSISNRTI